jgi:VWFA-related protein
MNMNKRLAITLLFFLCMAAFAVPSALSGGQQNASKPNAPPPQSRAADAQNPQARDKDEAVRISVTLVQIDAVVTDGKGRYVTDLKPEDFEVSEDGKRQFITNFSYVTRPPAAAPVTEAPRPEKNMPPAPPTRLRPEQVRRTIALVVDDLGLSFESTAYVRNALKKYVSQQIEPGDLVAIIRTGAGMGALQQFTSDRRQLDAAIERIRWNPIGRSGISAFAPIEAGPKAGNPRAARAGQAPGDDPAAAAGDSLDRFREEVFAVGTLGALNYVIRGLTELPGRKSVILFSDGFSVFNQRLRDTNGRVFDALRRLTDLANRASVVIYSMDARGLQVLGLTAEDNTYQKTSSDIANELEGRRQDYFESQGGLAMLAAETGGFFIHDTNDLNAGIRRVLNDQQGYYLLGYVPEASSFRAVRGATPFHKISVKVKRAGLHVRSRTGFYGVPDEVLRPARRTPAQQVWAALTSPFASGDIRLKLTSLFGYDLKTGAYMRSLLHIDPSEITFTKEADGLQKAVVDVVAFTFGDNGQVIDRESREFTFRVPDEAYQQIMRKGLLYKVNVPIKKPGAYQLRVAVRDAASEKIGSANQFIEVPDVGKKRLTLSGLVMTGNDLARPPDSQVMNVTEGAEQENDALSGPSMRRLRVGMELTYLFSIYNAVLDRTTGKPELEAQVRLLRDGQAVYTGQRVPVRLGPQADWRQIVAGGKLQLGADIGPGEYVLQVIITDRLAKEKANSATQWIDFEVLK